MSQCTNQRQSRPRSDNRIEVNKRILIIKKNKLMKRHMVGIHIISNVFIFNIFAGGILLCDIHFG